MTIIKRCMLNTHTHTVTISYAPLPLMFGAFNVTDVHAGPLFPADVLPGSRHQRPGRQVQSCKSGRGQSLTGRTLHSNPVFLEPGAFRQQQRIVQPAEPCLRVHRSASQLGANVQRTLQFGCINVRPLWHVHRTFV